jgi:hypothetical protein
MSISYSPLRPCFRALTMVSLLCCNRMVLCLVCGTGVHAITTVTQAVSADRQAESESHLPDRVKEVLHWLPADTQTVVVVLGPCELSRPAPSYDATERRGEEAFGPSSLFSSPRLLSSDWGVMVKDIDGLQVELTIGAVGGKRELCQIIIFGEAAREASCRASQVIKDRASQTIVLQAPSFSVFKLKSDSFGHLYHAELAPQVILFSTHLEYLQEVLARVDRKDHPRALPTHLPEWKQLNTKSRHWAIWHCPPHAPKPDPAGIGVVFFVSAEKKDQAVFRFLTRADNPLSIYSRERFFERAKAEIHEIEPGVVEVIINLKELQNDQFLRNWFPWILSVNLGLPLGGGR